MRYCLILSLCTIFVSITFPNILYVPECYSTVQQAIISAADGDTVSVNFGRVDGQRTTLSCQRIMDKEITLEIRNKGREELLRMIKDINIELNVHNHPCQYLPSGWQGQGWVNRPDMNSSDDVPSLAIDSFGYPWVIWSGFGSNYTLAYTKWNGINWDDEKGVGPNPPGVISRGQMSISFNNQNIAWGAWNNVSHGNYYDIGYSSWDDTCWIPEAQVNLPDSTELDFAPRIACGGGEVWAVWYGGPTDVSPYIVYSSRWNGTNWEPDMQVSPPDGMHHWFCDVAVDSAGTPHVIWCEVPHWRIYYSHHNGVHWTNPMIVNDTTLVEAAPWADPRVAIDQNGNLHISFTGNLVGANYRDIFYSEYDSIRWSPATKISQDSVFDEWFSDIAVDRPNNIWITWDRQDEGYDQFRIYASHFDGTSWSEEMRLDNDTSHDDAGPSICLDNHGDPWVCFQGIPYTANNYDIFYNRYISGGAVSEEPVMSIKKCSFLKVSSNPIVSSFRISFQVMTPSYAELKIYDLNGKCVKTLINRYKVEGEYSTHWDGVDSNNREVSTGIYFCWLWIGVKQEVRKLILLK